jgi:hypothetical protein
MRWCVPIVLLSILLALPSLAQNEKDAKEEKSRAARPARDPSWYVASVAEDEKGQFLMVHFWSRGPLFRSEAVLAGRKIVTIVDRATYFIVDEVSGKGIAIARSPDAIARDTKRARPFANDLDQLLIDGGELIGNEDANGQVVDVYRVTNKKGRRTIWMSTTNPPVPLRIVTYDRATATSGKVDYMNWLSNPLIADHFFAPDSRVEVRQFSYEEYRRRIRLGPVGPAPVLYRHLLHGEGDVEP